MSYKPEFKGPIEGWTVNFCKKSMWRVEGSMEWADVMQEAYIVYLRCCSKYPDIDTPQHFMVLYQRAWVNQFTNFANADTKLRALVSENVLSPAESGASFESVGELMNDGHLALMIKQAPSEVRMVLNLFLSAPTEILDLALSDWKQDQRRKTGGSAKICRMLGLPADLNVIQMVEEYFLC